MNKIPPAGRMVNGKLSATPRWDVNQPKAKNSYPTLTAKMGSGIYYWPGRGKEHIYNRFFATLQSHGLRRPPLLFIERLMGLPDGWLWPLPTDDHTAG